jgi:beta-glucanase (GH16 family)
MTARTDAIRWLARVGSLAALAGLIACGGGSDAATAAAPEAFPAAPPAAPPAAAPVAAAPTPPATGAPAGYALVWSDEFDTAGLPDAAKWVHDTGRNRLGWHNNELQYYAADRPENAVVRDGRLIVTARRESLGSLPDWGGQRYSSARLITRGKAAWTYGFFEVRAKLPCGQGSWPAIWMLGSGGRWPLDGELDIMEHAGSNPSRVFSSVHTQAGSGGAANTGATSSSDACTAFHNYQMTWTAGEIRFAIDGVEHHRYVNARTGADAWPFDAPQFMILNLAIGGDIGGAVDDRIFPIAMQVEHVRVYQVVR